MFVDLLLIFFFNTSVGKVDELPMLTHFLKALMSSFLVHAFATSILAPMHLG